MPSSSLVTWYLGTQMADWHLQNTPSRRKGRSMATIPRKTAAAPRLTELDMLCPGDAEVQPPANGDGDVQGMLQIPEDGSLSPTSDRAGWAPCLLLPHT